MNTNKSTNSNKNKGGKKDQYPIKVKPYLDLIASWAREGMLEQDIAKQLGVGVSTWHSYKTRYPELQEALKINRELADAKVENALYQKATRGNVTAMIFWLKNRQPEKWNKKSPDEDTNKVEVNISYNDLMKAQLEYESNNKGN